MTLYPLILKMRIQVVGNARESFHNRYVEQEGNIVELALPGQVQVDSHRRHATDRFDRVNTSGEVKYKVKFVYRYDEKDTYAWFHARHL